MLCVAVFFGWVESWVPREVDATTSLPKDLGFGVAGGGAFSGGAVTAQDNHPPA